VTGPLGLTFVSGTGEVTYHPAFYAAQGLSAIGGRPRYRCRSSSPDTIAAVAGTDRDGRRLAWLANLTGQNQAVNLVGDLTVSQTFVLDEESFAQPRVVAGSGDIELRPYAFACLTLAEDVS
jgi:hypothetical protein